MRKRFISSFVILLGFAATVRAEFRAQHVHEHGTARVNIAVDGTALDIAFDSPAINVIGFEHEPRSAEEHAALAAANATFGQGRGLFFVPSAASCSLTKSSLQPISYEKDGDDDRPGGNPNPANFDVTFRFFCAHPENLEWIELRLFEHLKGAQRVIVNIVTQKLQSEVELSPGQNRVPLR